MVDSPRSHYIYIYIYENGRLFRSPGALKPSRGPKKAHCFALGELHRVPVHHQKVSKAGKWGSWKDRKIVEIKKSYKAIVQGSLKSNTGEINLPLIHSVRNRKKREVNKKGREAITKYTTISRSDSHSLLDIDLITGRNHQIRAHFEYLKTPIVNDTLYGANRSLLLDKDTICLQSYELEFVLFEKDYKFSINEPDYFSSIMEM